MPKGKKIGTRQLETTYINRCALRIVALDSSGDIAVIQVEVLATERCSLIHDLNASWDENPIPSE